MNDKELINLDMDLYLKILQLNLMLGIGARKSGVYLTLCVFLRLKKNVEYSALFKEVAQIKGVRRATVYSVLQNAVKRAEKEAHVPGLFAEIVKLKEKCTPIDFVMAYIDFLQEFDFKQEDDEEGVSHAYYFSRTDGRRIPTLN